MAAVALAASAAALAKVRIHGYWWENPLPYQVVPKGLTSLSAAQCGVCHQEIYQEWQVSTHAYALKDQQFQAEMKKEPPSAWLCLNCHTPLENQLKTIAVGVHGNSTVRPILKDNPRYDATLAAEGITCAVCHVQDGVVLGPWGDSARAPHPVRKAPSLLTEKKCAECHQATAAYTDTLVCNFDTAEEWRRSSYFARGRSCFSCHMPEVTRAVAPGGPARRSRRHLFIGAKIPKEKDIPDAHRRFYDLFPPGLTVEILSGPSPLKLRLTNSGAGHRLPTGDPERFILVKAALLDAKGVALDQQTYRIGQVWVWHPTARKVSDNSLKPHEQRRIEMHLVAPRAARPARLRLVVENWRMSAENAAYHNLTDYPLSAVVFQTEKALP
jgi:hypothetical protein